MHNQIPPHGGELVNRLLSGEKRKFWVKKGEKLPSITVDNYMLSDIEMIACGAMSPLEGFMCRDDYNHVVEHMRLTSGLPWPMPIVLGVSRDQADEFDVGAQIALKDDEGTVIAILHLQEKYLVNKKREIAKVYQTTDIAHPGVAYVVEKRGDVLLGGDIDIVNMPKHKKFGEFRLTPFETRHMFEQRGWSKIVGFQTKNPIHRAHEYLLKCALEICDGLLIHPLLCDSDNNSLEDEVKMSCYSTLKKNYYPEDRVILSVFPGNTKYAGPREAVLHTIIRKNFGCTHFIVGRDHAEVGNYYKAYESQNVFKEFGPHELEITPLLFENAVYCKKCEDMVSQKTCPHSAKEHVSLNSSEVDKLLKKGERPPKEFMRPEIADILIKSLKA